MESLNYHLGIHLIPNELPSDKYMHISESSIQLLGLSSFPFSKLILEPVPSHIFEFISPSLPHLYRGINLNLITYTELPHSLALFDPPERFSSLTSSIFSSDNRENFTYSCSFFQISNETLTDLLQSPARHQKLHIKRDLNNSVIIENLSEYVVEKHSDAEFLLSQGLESSLLSNSNDQVLIFQFFLESRRANSKGLFSKSKFSIVSLPSTGQSVKAFKSVLSCLRSNSSAPYKDSKLTQVLSDSLTLTSPNLIISTISPFEQDSDLTLETLNTTKNLSAILVTPHKNLSKTVAKPESIQNEISKLRTMIKAKNKCEDIWKAKERSDALKGQISKKTTIEEVEELIKENKELRVELQQLIGRPLAENDLEHPECFQDALVLTEDLIKRRKLDLASAEMKDKLVKDGRCLICTLKQPCKHSNFDAVAIFKPKEEVLKIGYEDSHTFLTGTDVDGPKKFRIRSSRGKLEVFEKSGENKTEKMIKEAQERLRVLNKIEVYREEQLRKEIEKMESEAKAEQEEILKKKMEIERKQKYFDAQKEKLQEYSLKKREEAITKQKKERPLSQKVKRRPLTQGIKIRDYENRRFQVFEILRQQSKHLKNSSKKETGYVQKDDSLDLLNIEDY